MNNPQGSPILDEDTKRTAVLTQGIDKRLPDLVSGKSARPALTRLALLMRANPDVAACVFRDPANASSAHPQYTLALSEQDQATVCDIQARSLNIGDFLLQLAEVIDGPNR